jgi:hypothetical protein
LQTYDTLTLKLVSDVSTGCQYTVYGGRVDAIRHRAAILAHRTSDGADIVLPLTLATGSVGTPIDVDTSGVSAGWYRGIAMNQTTGLVYLSHTDGPCTAATGPSALISVNLDSGALTPAVVSLSGFAGDTSQADFVDLTTGTTVSTVSGFNFVLGFWGGQFDPDPAYSRTDPGVDIDNQPMQLDPATRTGWVISGDGSQIQQFKY